MARNNLSGNETRKQKSKLDHTWAVAEVIKCKKCEIDQLIELIRQKNSIINQSISQELVIKADEIEFV